ncbi:MAG: ABC transporter permease [Treponema sp.]|nr:ABC transporter permease [Treponema sp.]
MAFRYFWRYRRRYLFLFMALGFGFGVLTVVSSLKDSMKENLYLSAQSHYAGDIVAMGNEPGEFYHLTKNEQNAIFASAEKVNLDPSSVAVRTTIYSMKNGSLFFNGNVLALKYVVGADWEGEKNYFEQLSYIDPPAPFDDTSILLSRPIAQELGARQGDSITLEVLTVSGQKNTGTFVVSGIAEDSNFFSYYKVIISRLTMNRLIGFADEDCSLIGFYLKNKNTVEQKRELLYADLKTRTRTAPLVYDRNSFSTERDNDKSGIRIFLLTLPVYLSEVAQLMDAIDLASYVLFIMILAIITVSAAVTCRLILHERTRETGTLRALGFYEADLRFILKTELFLVSLFSMAAGFAAAMLINRFLSLVSFSGIPGFEIFMQDGRLTARYLPGTIVVNIIMASAALAAAIGGPIFRHSRNPLPDMLSGGIH